MRQEPQGRFSREDNWRGGTELLWLQKLIELEEQQKREVSALNDVAAIANKRYRGGLASSYEALEAQQLLFPAEMALSQTGRDRQLAVVQLYKRWVAEMFR